ncbi:hypothetical protein BH11ARM2_BH11ARM2_25190 [soil metagenome]
MATMRVRALLLLLSVAIVPSGFAEQKPKPVPPKNEVKGQGQMAGAYVKFGEVYSLANGVNFEILTGRYTMEFFPTYGAYQNTPSEKLVVLDIAVKNWRKTDLDFGGAGGDLITLVDSTGAKYTGEAQLKSHGIKETYLTLKPGQGVGQPGLNDPYRVAFKVPLDAEIDKIIINQPRLNKKEEVLRYLMAGTDKEADPGNIIAPLPPEVRDPAKEMGAVALKEGIGKLGVPLPAGGFTYQIDKIEPNVGALSESYTPEEGHHFVVATLKLTNIDLRDLSSFDGKPRDSYILDADGDRHPLTVFLKASTPEESPSDTMSPGQTKTIRLVFDMPSSATPQTLVLAGSYYPWKFDLTK